MPQSSAALAIDAVSVRQCGRGVLSLALMAARNRTLELLDQHLASDRLSPDSLWIAGHAAWFAERWTLRDAAGTAGTARSDRPASLLPQADAWFEPPSRAWTGQAPDPQAVRDYMLQQLEGTLELLETTDEPEAHLHLFRAALWHEDLQGEALVTLAQSQGVALTVQRPPLNAQRPELCFPATRWTLGSPPEGFAPALERPCQEVEVPPFDIDAQPVCWSQFVEFVNDAGYDRPELWHPAGWAWVQETGRRAPRHVEQMGVASGAVMQTLFGKSTRLAASQPVMHVSWWEADAWARWSGRRLPTEPEWEVAAVTATQRGFRWGDVHEWTAGTLRLWPGFCPDRWAHGTPLDPLPHVGLARVRRGTSFATPDRHRHPRARSFALPHCDEDFVGFRTCAH